VSTQKVIVNPLYNRVFWRLETSSSTGAWNIASTLNRPGDVTITHGDNVPSWREKIRLKQFATTSLTVDGYKMSCELPLGRFTIRRIYKPTGAFSGRTDTNGHLAHFTSVPGLPTLATTRADNQALTDFVKKAVDAQRTLLGGVMLGEIREVVRLIRRPVKLLRHGMVDYLHQVDRRLRQRRGVRSLKSRKSRLHAVNRMISSTWLEYQFGWAPLVSDIEDGLIAAYKIANERRPSKVVTGLGHEETSGVQSNASYSVGFGTVRSEFEESDIVDIRYKGCIHLDSGLTGAPRRLGLSMSDFIPTVGS
jgi:hypothetical protein